jgi:hypothetical protein
MKLRARNQEFESFLARSARIATVSNMCSRKMEEEVAKNPEGALSARELSDMVEQCHGAAAEFIKGNPGPYKQLFSQRDDVTLGNPPASSSHRWLCGPRASSDPRAASGESCTATRIQSPPPGT